MVLAPPKTTRNLRRPISIRNVMKFHNKLSPEQVKLAGVVYDKSGASTIFWRFRDKCYMASRSNGWQPRDVPENLAGQISKDEVDASSEVIKKIHTITQTYLLQK
jgi:hypothetical protein